MTLDLTRGMVAQMRFGEIPDALWTETGPGRDRIGACLLLQHPQSEMEAAEVVTIAVVRDSHGVSACVGMSRARAFYVASMRTAGSLQTDTRPRQYGLWARWGLSIAP